MNMEHFMETTRKQLKEYENYLENDIQEFNSKLKSTRDDLSDYFNRQIEYLRQIESKFNKELNYFQEENNKTCYDNQQEFDRLCLSINKNDHDSKTVSKFLEDFKLKFPLRPKMLKSIIPKYDFKDIQIDDLIIKENGSISPSTNNNCSSIVKIESTNHSFIPIDKSTNNSRQFSTTSIGSSYHKQFASENNENKIEGQSRLSSTCSRMSEVENTIDILFKINFEHTRTPRLMIFNEEKNSLLIYSLYSHQFEYLSLNSRQFSFIDIPFNESILNIGYSRIFHLFYLTTRQTNRFILFDLNEEIEIKEEIELIKEKDRFINVHLYDNFIYFLYLTSSSILMFGKYNFQTSSFDNSINFENKLYDYEQRSTFQILDFTLNEEFLCFLIHFKNKVKSKSKIVIHDYQTMNKIHSFDLIDSIRPISISHNQNNLLFYINDPDSRLIHFCNYQEYFISINLSHFGICSTNDGNLVVITKRDIRILNIQNYLNKKKSEKLF